MDQKTRKTVAASLRSAAAKLSSAKAPPLEDLIVRLETLEADAASVGGQLDARRWQNDPLDAKAVAALQVAVKDAEQAMLRCKQLQKKLDG